MVILKFVLLDLNKNVDLEFFSGFPTVYPSAFVSI